MGCGNSKPTEDERARKVKSSQAKYLVKRLQSYDRKSEQLYRAYEVKEHEKEDENEKITDIDYTLYEYPFENVVFEGGGNKGLAYSGAVRVLEEVGIWKNVKRIAGTSAGAMTAALLAVGYDSYDLQRFLELDLREEFLDATCGCCTLLPNLFRYYGWHPGNRIHEWFGRQLEVKTQNANITFLELYKKYGKELCVVVTNINQMTSEYCHPKTTPDMLIKTAVRMSMSIPILFASFQQENNGNNDYYVDGGLLANYPIHCFDGWFLSLKPEDSFMRRLQPLSDLPKLFDKKERFGTFNEKTLGFLLYADHEQDVMREALEQRVGVRPPKEKPKTKLAKVRIEQRIAQKRAEQEHDVVAASADRFMQTLSKYNLDGNDVIDRKELEAAMKDASIFTAEDKIVLFGDDVTVDDAADAMDTDGNGEISYHEITKFIEKNGVDLQARFLGYERRHISSVKGFLGTLQDTLLVNVKRIYTDERDISRTVGINTDYIGTNDFDMEPEDKRFVVEQGTRSTCAFLRHYVATNKPPTKTKVSPNDSQNQQCSPTSVIHVASV